MTTTGTAPPVVEVDGSLSRADRLQPLLLLASIGVGLGLGRALPSVSEALEVGVTVGVFVLITLVLYGVDPGEMTRAFRARRFLAAAVGINFVVNPVLAWGLGRLLLADHPDLRAGLLLFLVTPCIGWYLVFTEMAGGDRTLAVNLLGINLVLQVLLLPVYLAVFVGEASAVPTATVARSVVVFLVLPAIAAALLRVTLRRLRLGEVDAAVGPAKTMVLAFVIVSMFASQADEVIENRTVLIRLIVPITLFFVVAFAAALVVGRALQLSHAERALLVFTTTSRNSEASLAIAATAFASPLVGLTVVLGPVIELPLLIAMVPALRRLAPAGEWGERALG